MRLRKRSFVTGLVLILLLGAFTSPGTASELSDAEQRYSDLRRPYEANLEAVNVTLPKSEQVAIQCIAQLGDSMSPVDSSAREACQQDLLKIRAEMSLKSSQILQQKSELEVLERSIQALRASSGSATPMSGSAGTSSGGSSASNTQSVSPTENSLAQTSDTPSSLPGPNKSPTASPAPIPTPAQKSEPQVATSATTPSSSQSPSAAPGSKVSAAKPAVKKRTITCVKGKVTRKVTAVKPVCPKGFKIRKK